ncbi:MAG: hypothetical protein ABUT39_20625 [Acidobacteriota bacterium]
MIGPASTPVDNRVQISWSNGAPASASFNIYRALGTCAAPGPFELVASGVPGPSYLDGPVSGGVTWAYLVNGLDATGVCESDPSGCVQATPTGSCTVGPVFAGASGVINPAGETCALSVSWPPATSRCGGAVTYDVFRSGSPDFVPSAANRVATGLSGTSFQDLGALSSGSVYYYVVRAVDSGNGQADGNTVRRAGIPTGPGGACHTPQPPPMDFYTAAPCRLLDTRAGAPLQPGETRTFLLVGTCGIPAQARALSLNVTAVGAAAGGELILFPADQAQPTASSISFQAGQNRANNAMVPLSAGGAVQVRSSTTGTIHLVLDVNGWFQK